MSSQEQPDHGRAMPTRYQKLRWRVLCWWAHTRRVVGKAGMGLAALVLLVVICQIVGILAVMGAADAAKKQADILATQAEIAGQVEALKKERDTARTELISLNDQIALTRAQTASQTVKLNDLIERQSHMQKQYDGGASRYAQLEGSRQELEIQYEQAQTSMAELSGKIEPLTQRYNDMKKAIAAAEIEMGQLQEQASGAETHRRRLLAESERLGKQIEADQLLAIERLNTTTETSRKAAIAKAELATTESRIEAARQTLQSEEAKISKLRVRKTELDAEIEQQLARTDQVGAERVKAEANLKSVRHDLTETSERLTIRQGALGSIEALIHEAEGRLQRLSQQIDTLEAAPAMPKDKATAPTTPAPVTEPTQEPRPLPPGDSTGTPEKD